MKKRARPPVTVSGTGGFIGFLYPREGCCRPQCADSHIGPKDRQSCPRFSVSVLFCGV